MSRADLGLIFVVIYLAGVVMFAIQKVEARLGASAKVRRKRLWAVAIGLTLWLAITGLAAQEGLLLDVNAFPPPAMRILLPSLLLIAAIAFSAIGGRLAEGLTYPQLVGFQIFRLPVEFILYLYYLDGRIPVVMTFEGRNFDVITALSALLLWPLVKKGIAGKRTLWAWNILGSALLLNILTTAVLTMPGPWHSEPSAVFNSLPFHWPSVWILFCVLLALLGHLLTFRRLLRPQAY